MLTNAEKSIQRLKAKENARIGDVYAECEKRGCPRHFAETFNTRVETSPFEQTKAFITLGQKEKINNWRIYLEVMLDLRPEHPKHNEWKKAIALIG